MHKTHSRASWWRPRRSSRSARVSRKARASMGTRSSTFFASRCSLDAICAQADHCESAVSHMWCNGTQQKHSGPINR